MGRLRFLLKLAFICNLCFLLVQFSRYINMSKGFEAIVKSIIPLGMMVAFPLNVVTLIVAIVMLIMKRITWRELPPYVFIVNIIILVSQFFFLF
jgi:type IV secretory pathway VirB2 component (pilin)